MAAEKKQELWKLTRLLKAFTLMMHMLHLLMFHWPMHIIWPDSTSVRWDVCYAIVRWICKSHCNCHRCSTPLTENLGGNYQNAYYQCIDLVPNLHFMDLLCITGAELCKHLLVQWASQVALVVKNIPVNAGDVKRCGFDPWTRNIPWRRKWQPTPVFLPGKSHEPRNLAGDSHGVTKRSLWGQSMGSHTPLGHTTEHSIHTQRAQC